MNLLIERKHRVLALTLNRPEKRNALNSEMCHALVENISAAQSDDQTGAVFIQAVGQVFCAGMDLDEAAASNGDELAEIHEKLFTIGAVARKPVVIAVKGAALGGGLGLVAQGHFVLAGESSKFGLPEVHVGLWPFLVWRAVESAIGHRRTLALSLSGRSFTAAHAHAWGLVDQICQRDEVCSCGGVAAHAIAKSSPVALRVGMQYARESRDKSWLEAGALAAELRNELMGSEDFKEGFSSFKEKREPRWPSLTAKRP